MRLAKCSEDGWKMVKRLKVIHNLRDRVDVGKVL